MGKKMEIAVFGEVVKEMYRAFNDTSSAKKSVKDIAQQFGTSVMTTGYIKDSLVAMKWVQPHGAARGRTYTWNSEYAAFNPKMIAVAYRMYQEISREQKVKYQESTIKQCTLEEALHTLTKLGYTGVISKHKRSGHTTVTTSIDLSKF